MKRTKVRYEEMQHDSTPFAEALSFHFGTAGAPSGSSPSLSVGLGLPPWEPPPSAASGALHFGLCVLQGQQPATKVNIQESSAT